MTIYGSAVRCVTHADCWNARVEQTGEPDYVLGVHGTLETARAIAEQRAAKRAKALEERNAPAIQDELLAACEYAFAMLDRHPGDDQALANAAHSLAAAITKATGVELDGTRHDLPVDRLAALEKIANAARSIMEQSEQLLDALATLRRSTTAAAPAQDPWIPRAVTHHEICYGCAHLISPPAVAWAERTARSQTERPQYHLDCIPDQSDTHYERHARRAAQERTLRDLCPLCDKPGPGNGPHHDCIEREAYRLAYPPLGPKEESR